MEVTITRVEPSDNPALASMIRAVFDEHGAPHAGTVYVDPTTDLLFELFQNPKAALWVARIGGKIAGCCGVYPTDALPDGYAELVKFYLDDRYRRKGIGKSLMQKSIASAIDLGYNRLYLESFPEFSKAVTMYEKLGFVSIDHPLGKSGHTACTIWMTRDLTKEYKTV